MKKSLTRVLSLVLVLVMMLGVMPVASADTLPANDYAVSPSTVSLNLTNNKTAQISVTKFITADGKTNALAVEGVTVSTEYSGYDNEIIAVSSTGLITAKKAGSTDVTVTSVASKGGENAWQYSHEGTDTVHVTVSDVYGITIPSALTMQPGTNEQLEAAVTKNGVADTTATVTWSSDNENVTVNNGLVVALDDATGTATITAAIKDGNTVLASDTCEVTIQKPYTVTVTPAEKTAKPGETVEFKAAVKNSSTNAAVSGATVTWSSSNAKVVHQGNGKFAIAADATGTSNITATYTAGDQTYTSEAAVLTIQDDAYTVTVTPATATVAPGGTKELTAAVKTKAGASVTPASGTLTWSSSDTDVATVSASGVVTAGTTKTGTVTITAKFTYEGTEYTSNACAVTVSHGQIIEANASYPVASVKEYSLTPQYDSDMDGKADTQIEGIEYTYTKKAGTATLSGNVVSTTNGGWAQITITAKKGDAVLATKDVYVSFYVVASKIEVTMKDGSSELPFGESGKTVIGSNRTLGAMMLSPFNSMTEEEDEVHFSYSDLTGRVGKLTGLYANSYNWNYVTALRDMKFVVTGGAGGVWEFTYEILKRGTDDVILGQGAVKIKFDGKSNAIEYSTDYTKSVTVSESDFYKFWKAADASTDLSYVKFNISGIAPSYGKLYTSKSYTTSGYEAKASDYFGYGSYTDRTYKDLGSLTFVPLRSKTTAYTETIPFTMYGKTGETVYGNLVFHVNENGSDITPRGIFFSSAYDTNGTTTTADDISFADLIANTYKDETGKELGHVVFTLPAAEDGALYSEIPASGGNTKVAEGARLRTGAELYYEKTTGKLRLQNAAFIPAAGKSGKITLSYTAYDTAGGSADSGTLVLNVKTKSASAVFSDVNAKNYSWASDSVDFLYYEGTAQGSNGKYNPSANITRRDFMLMLYRAFLAEDYGTFTVTSNFPDVVKGADSYSKEIYQAVGVAKYLGIAQGTNDRFNPTANITRQEAMVLIYRTLETINKDLRTESGVKLTSMKDYAKISSWATTAISNLVGHGVIKGNNDNIKPLDPISRAEMAAILHRVITY